MSERKLVTFDWAIKRLLRSKANFGVLEGFLSELLHDDIRIKAILESSSTADTRDDKTNRVDLLVQDRLDRAIIIEVQYEHEGDYFHRIAFGASKALVESIDIGHAYGAIKRVISISILHFDLGRGLDYIYTGRTEFRGMHHNDLLNLSEKQMELYHCMQVADIFPEYFLLRVNTFNDVARDGLDQWIHFLKTGNIQPGASGKGLAEAKRVLDLLKLSPTERADYDDFIKARRIAIGVAQSTVLRAERAETALIAAEQQKEEAQRREQEAQRLKEEAQRQEKVLTAKLEAAIKALVATGLSETAARQLLEK